MMMMPMMMMMMMVMHLMPEHYAITRTNAWHDGEVAIQHTII